MDEIDVKLPAQMEPFLQNLATVIVTIAAIGIIFPVGTFASV